MPAPVFSAKLTLACCPPLQVASLSHAHSHGAACACALSIFWLHWSWYLKPSAMLSFSAKPLRVVAYQNLPPSCLDLGSCRSLLEIFNALLRSKVRTLPWLVFSNASNFQLRNCGHSLFEALSASCKLSLVPSGLFRDVSRRHACWTVLCDSAGTWPNWCIRKKIRIVSFVSFARFGNSKLMRTYF